MQIVAVPVAGRARDGSMHGVKSLLMAVSASVVPAASDTVPLPVIFLPALILSIAVSVTYSVVAFVMQVC